MIAADDIVIVSALRTPIGKIGGQFKEYQASDLAAFVIKAILSETKIDPHLIDEVVLGNLLTAGEGQHPARQVIVKAGLPNIPSFTVGKNCGSGLKAILLARNAIACGDKEVVIAGGMESLSNAPRIWVSDEAFAKADEKAKLESNLLDYVATDASICPVTGEHIISYTEQCAHAFAQKHGISDEVLKAEIDALAFQSHETTIAAESRGEFAHERISVDGLTTDELPKKIALERIAKKRNTRFNPEGCLVSPYNSPQFADGAALVILMKASKAKALGLIPLVKILGTADGVSDLAHFILAPKDAVLKLLKKTGTKVSDYDLIETNSSFGVQTIVLAKELGYDMQKVNVKGDCVSQGHPIAAAGVVRLVTLIHALCDRKLKKGLVSICLGGGDAVAVAVERVLAS